MWVLIIMTVAWQDTRGAGVAAAEFTSRHRCEVAGKTAVFNRPPTVTVRYQCTRK